MTDPKLILISDPSEEIYYEQSRGFARTVVTTISTKSITRTQPTNQRSLMDMWLKVILRRIPKYKVTKKPIFFIQGGTSGNGYTRLPQSEDGTASVNLLLHHDVEDEDWGKSDGNEK